jgi:hypothetical protein
MREQRVAEPAKYDDPGWGSLVGQAVLGFVVTTVIWSFPQVVATIGDLGAGHGAWDITITLLAIAVVGLLVLSIIESRRPRFARSSTRAEDREERRAWLVDLREQGASRGQLLVQRLSIAFVAAPMMAVRRNSRARMDRWSPRMRVHDSAIGAVVFSVAVQVHLGVDWLVLAGLLVLAVLGDVIGCGVVTIRERRRGGRR